MFVIDHLTVSIDNLTILNHLSLTVGAGEVHALMGPNGSGKSTLAQTIVGSPHCCVMAGSLTFNGEDISALSPHERAKRGIFLSFQQPPAIPGLKVCTLLHEMSSAVHTKSVEVSAFEKEVEEHLDFLKMDYSFLERSCNDGFSGGEKKRFELLQLLVANPQLIILDEIDSGLDIDALKLVAQVIEKLRAANPHVIVLIITHYQRILNYITPDRVHVIIEGAIMQSSDVSLVHSLEQKGYDGYLKSN